MSANYESPILNICSRMLAKGVGPFVTRNSPSNKVQKCQGDHGGCRANYRCCIPALAGFVSPHSMGPGTENLPHPARSIKQNSASLTRSPPQFRTQVLPEVLYSGHWIILY